MSQPTIGNVPASQPSRQDFERLMAAFGNGWERARPQEMASVFAEDAVFIPYAFNEPLRGREAIQSYWSDIPEEQAVISFRFGEVFTAGPWFASEFTCSFRRIKTGEWMQVSGAVFCETASGKISEMRMYWDRAVVEAP